MKSVFQVAGSLLLMLGLSACNQPEEIAAPTPPLTAILQLEPAPLELSDVLPGRVAALRVAEIRPQVSGIVAKRLFEQGAEVKAGQALFQLNASPFAAEVAVAAAAVQSAEAGLAGSELQLRRLQQLQHTGAVSRQAYDEANTQHARALADVAQAKATLQRRQLDLSFATVEAPIAGRIDQTLVSEGALVSSTDAQPLTRVQQIDQVYVDVRQSASQLQAITAEPGSDIAADILDSQGQATGLRGKVLFSGTSVEPGTGDVQLRVLVDNPQHRLLPGMYVQARIQRARYDQALTIPQQAVVRHGDQTFVWLLDASQQVRQVAVTLGEQTGQHYRLVAGLSAGQQIVVAGLERLSDGITVETQPWLPAADPLTADPLTASPVGASAITVSQPH